MARVTGSKFVPCYAQDASKALRAAVPTRTATSMKAGWPPNATQRVQHIREAQHEAARLAADLAARDVRIREVRSGGHNPPASKLSSPAWQWWPHQSSTAHEALFNRSCASHQAPESMQAPPLSQSTLAANFARAVAAGGSAQGAGGRRAGADARAAGPGAGRTGAGRHLPGILHRVGANLADRSMAQLSCCSNSWPALMPVLSSLFALCQNLGVGLKESACMSVHRIVFPESAGHPQELHKAREGAGALCAELAAAQQRGAGAEMAHALLLRDRDAAIGQRAAQHQARLALQRMFKLL